MSKTLVIDTTRGGNGDVWMRLASLYVVSILLHNTKIALIIPDHIKPLAVFTFGDRLSFIDKNEKQVDLTFTSLGIKDLIKPILKGRKFVSPYQKLIIKQKKEKKIKDYLNNLILDIADILGVIQVPSNRWENVYQGYVDVVGIKLIRSVSYDQFLAQLKLDFNVIADKLQEGYPISEDLEIPPNINNSLLFFANGTSRQFVPIWWAKQYLKDAYYAFYYKDVDAIKYANAGLKICLYKAPGDIIKLGQIAKWALSTDSFPSHLLQFSLKNCTITLTEASDKRIIMPFFEGTVIKAVAPCHPCQHLDRKNHPTCEAGHVECINWIDKIYTRNILNSIKPL